MLAIMPTARILKQGVNTSYWEAWAYFSGSIGSLIFSIKLGSATMAVVDDFFLQYLIGARRCFLNIAFGGIIRLVSWCAFSDILDRWRVCNRLERARRFCLRHSSRFFFALLPVFPKIKTY